MQKSLAPKEDGEFRRDVAENWQTPMGVMLAKGLSSYRKPLGCSVPRKAKENYPVARWLAKIPGDGWDILVAPLPVAGQLRRDLWWRCYGAVVTSATLTALNSFNKLSWESGLPDWANYQRVVQPV